MSKGFFVFAVLGAVALVGAGCTATDTPPVSVDTTQGSDGVVVEVEGDGEVEVEVTPVVPFSEGDNVYLDLGYGWYEGVVQTPCEGGVFVQHRGLNVLCFAPDKMTMNVVPSVADISVGTMVIANIGRGEMFGGQTIYPFYSAEVVAVAGTEYTVEDSNGTEHTVTLENIRLR